MPAAIALDEPALDVGLLNDRPYVQGTQMIARACERVAGPPATIVGAKFTRLTDRQVFARRSGGGVPAGALPIGSLTLRQAGQTVDIEFLEGQQAAPLRRRPVAVRIADLAHDGKLTGRYAFEGATSLEGVLDALVQGIKQLHENQPQAVSDIWFTGLRQFELPIQGLPAGGGGQADVRRLRLMSDGRRHQSLLNVVLTLQDLPTPLGGLVTFAFRSQGASDVH